MVVIPSLSSCPSLPWDPSLPFPWGCTDFSSPSKILIKFHLRCDLYLTSETSDISALSPLTARQPLILYSCCVTTLLIHKGCVCMFPINGNVYVCESESNDFSSLSPQDWHTGRVRDMFVIVNCIEVFLHFPPVLLRHNWHTTLYSFKVFNTMIWCMQSPDDPWNALQSKPCPFQIHVYEAYAPLLKMPSFCWTFICHSFYQFFWFLSCCFSSFIIRGIIFPFDVVLILGEDGGRPK